MVLHFIGIIDDEFKIEKEGESFLYQGRGPICGAGTITGNLCKMNTSLYPGCFRG